MSQIVDETSYIFFAVKSASLEGVYHLRNLTGKRIVLFMPAAGVFHALRSITKNRHLISNVEILFPRALQGFPGFPIFKRNERLMGNTCMLLCSLGLR